MSITRPNEKKLRGRPRIDATLIGVRMPPELLGALDRFVTEERHAMSRPEALRIAFKQWATDRGFLPAAPLDEGKRPDELSADNDG